MWVFIALLGFSISAAVNILDKFIISEKKVSPGVFVFYSTIFLLPVLLYAVFMAERPGNLASWLVLILASVGFVAGLYTIYRAELTGAISHVGPLVGAAAPFFVVILSMLFLGEALSFRQLLAIALLIIGSFIISFDIGKGHRGWHLGMLWGVFSGLCFGVYHVASKYSYIKIGFASGIIWVTGFMGLCGLLLFLLPSVRQHFASPLPASKLAKNKEPGRGLIIAVNKILGIAALLLIQYASSLGSVSIVNALGGIQFAILIVAVALLTRFYPRLFKESYAQGELLQEGAAVLCIALGLYVLLSSV